jgi:UDP:flavonoid glycosyltransferase YjiC (YdhE family)
MGPNRHVLFLSRPDENHLYLTLAVAEELGRRGYRVTFATSDPFAEEDAESGVLLLRYGRDVRTLRSLPAFVARLRMDPVDLVVCDPRTYDDAVAIGREWGARVVVAHTNLATGETVDWPAERAYGEDYLYVHPAGRGTVFGDWVPSGAAQVLVVSLDTVPAGLLAEAFGADSGWQVLVLAADLTTGPLPPNFTPLPGPLAVVDHADVVLSDGGLPGIAAALRHGTPLVLAPATPGQHRHAARVAALGLGVVVRLADLDAAALRRTVARLAVDEPSRAAARRVRALARAAGAPARASDTLESRLAEDRRAA